MILPKLTECIASLALHVRLAVQLKLSGVSASVHFRDLALQHVGDLHAQYSGLLLKPKQSVDG